MKMILAAILAVLSLGTAQAADYVYMNKRYTDLTIDPTSFVEILGSGEQRSQTEILSFLDGEGETVAQLQFEDDNRGTVFTGVSRIAILGSPISGAPWISLKITPASEMNAIGPSTVLVLPENSTGNFDVVIEASDDLVSWLPFFSQTVNSQTAKKFFRTRVVRSQVAPKQP